MALAMSKPPFQVTPIAGASFGARIEALPGHEPATLLDALEAAPEALVDALHQAGGLLVMSGLHGITSAPQRLLALSRAFGSEVEDYRETLAAPGTVHPEVPQIFIVSNAPPASKAPPPRPDPPLTPAGALPTRFPHRRGWHTDQSYRRPPPDISLFYCVKPAPGGQGQTLYADGTGAYAALPDALAARVRDLVGLHARPGSGRSEQLIRAGEPPPPLAGNDRPQRQPVVRVHPVTGRPALYLCEAGQMDWLDGPFEDMEPGPYGEGAALLYELMTHYTAPEFVYVKEWQAGDMTIYDNRCLIHAATWFDTEHCERVMWRTTIAGNPGPEYAGEAKSWLRQDN